MDPFVLRNMLQHYGQIDRGTANILMRRLSEDTLKKLETMDQAAVADLVRGHLNPDLVDPRVPEVSIEETVGLPEVEQTPEDDLRLDD